jgi:hypothetical protein
MNWKGFGRKRSWLNQNYILIFAYNKGKGKGKGKGKVKVVPVLN